MGLLRVHAGGAVRSPHLRQGSCLVSRVPWVMTDAHDMRHVDSVRVASVVGRGSASSADSVQRLEGPRASVPPFWGHRGCFPLGRRWDCSCVASAVGFAWTCVSTFWGSILGNGGHPGTHWQLLSCPVLSRKGCRGRSGDPQPAAGDGPAQWPCPLGTSSLQAELASACLPLALPSPSRLCGTRPSALAEQAAGLLTFGVAWME